jgi:RNA polymerase sigma factor (sigma-70 family)
VQSNSDRRWPPLLVTVERVRDGDLAALTDVIEDGYPRLVAFFRGSGLPHADADDLAADTCEALVKNVRSLRRAEAFEAWFWTIARARLRTWIRRNRRPERSEPPGALPASPLELVEQGEEHALIRAALRRLSPKDRELLWLREVEGLSYEEIGGRVKAAVGAVRVACHRARKRLEDAYDQLSRDPAADG